MALLKTFTDKSLAGPSGPITAWDWDFGDGSGTSSLENPTYTYAAPGLYEVTLTVTGSGTDGTATSVVLINVAADAAPIHSDFSFSVSGLAVTFTDLSTPGPSGPITGWAWTFGDTNTSSSQNPSHTYAAAGTYTVTLTVTGTSPDGTDDSSHSFTVTTGGAPTFISTTSFSRPSFTPTRTVNFSTKAQLDAAIAGMQSGDLIKYNGTGVLEIANSSGVAYSLTKNPSSTVVIDFGCSHNIWDTSKITPNFVRFKYTGAENQTAFHINGCSNIRIYGGELDTGIGGTAMLINAPTHDFLWWDYYVAKSGGSGTSVRGSTSAGASSNTYNIDLRAEVNRWCMNPKFDNHSDKGTGFHGCILHGSTGNIYNSRFIFYAHDSLRPGEVSAGHTWVEGGGGSVIEIGNSYGTNYKGCTYYAKGVNNLQVPDASDSLSTGSGQTAGNVLNFWGSQSLSGSRVGWAEGVNISGAIVKSDNGSWTTNTVPDIPMDHGRHTNTNQSTAGGNISQPYQTITGGGKRVPIHYVDCT
jgi:PKD repeat protein